jgi:hypothetical protein
MMRLFRYVVLVLVANLCVAEEAIHLTKVPFVGTRFHAPADASAGLCAISPGQIDECSRVEVAGVQYAVAYRRKRFGRHSMTHIHTIDPRFVSTAGNRVGDFIQVERDRILSAPGFEIYAGGPVGRWTAVVGFNGKVQLEGTLKEVEAEFY